MLVLLALQAAIAEGSFGGGYRGVAFAVAAVFGARVLATLLFGAVLLGPLHVAHLARRARSTAAGPWSAPTALRAALLIVAPLWIDWTPDNALAVLLVTAFVTGVAERFWTVCRESAAPALLPAPPSEGATVRPLPDHMDALRRLSLRTAFVAMPLAAAALVVAALRQQPAGRRDRLVRPAPGGPRLVRRGRAVRRLAVACSPSSNCPTPAPRARGRRWKDCAGPRRARPSTRAAPARSRCWCWPAPPSPGRSRPPSPSPCCTPSTWAAAR